MKPTDDLSLYASYSRSYLPQSGDQFSGLTDVTEGLKPERFDNYEIGAKWEFVDGLLATAAVYRLDRTQYARRPIPTIRPAPFSPARSAAAASSSGLSGRVSQPLADFGRLFAAEGPDRGDHGRRAQGPQGAAGAAPQLLALEPLRRDRPGSALGLGVIARSKSYAAISNAVKLPGYARVDAALFYKLPGGLEAQVNFENLLGAHYFATANADNNIAPGAPRTIKAS